MESQTKIDLFISFAIFGMVCLVLFIAFLSVRHRSKVAEKEAKLITLEKQKQFEVFKSASESEEKQKEKIGKNMHDEIIPSLSVVERSIGANIQDFGTNDFDFERLKRDHIHIGQVMENIRGISHDLVPKTLLNLGLIEAIKEYVDQLDGVDRVKSVFENSTNFPVGFPFTIEDQQTMYRICLELFNNLQKHSKFAYLKVIVKNSVNEFEVQIMHNGTGITNSQIDTYTTTSKGLGLKSLKSRLLILQAKLDYSILPDFSQITLTVPLRK